MYRCAVCWRLMLPVCVVVLAIGLVPGEERLPAGVEDPFGLGPRLALLDHLKEVYQVTMPPGSSYKAVLARYHELKAPAKVDSNTAMQRDRLRRMRQALGLADDVQLPEDELVARYRKHQEAERARHGSGHSTAGVQRRSQDDGPAPRAGGKDQPPEAPAQGPAPYAGKVGRSDLGRVRLLQNQDADSDGGKLSYSFATKEYVVQTAHSKELAVQVSNFLHRFRAVVTPEMRLDRHLRMDKPTRVCVYASRQDYLQSSMSPPASSGGLCSYTYDSQGRPHSIRLGVYGTAMANFQSVLQHEAVHGIHIEAFGVLTHSWYAEGLAAYFENWDITKSAADNRKRRTQLLARLPYVRYQAGLDKLPDLGQFWDVTWDSKSPYRYQIAEAFVDYLMRDNLDMLRRCHAKCRAKAPAKRYFTKTEIKKLNVDWQRFLKAELKKSE